MDGTGPTKATQARVAQARTGHQQNGHLAQRHMTEQAETAINMIVLAAGDNVGVATRDIAAGAMARDIKGHTVTAQEAIPQGHKIALADIPPEAAICRFGVPVGIARQAIPTGHLAHVHNIASAYINNDEDHYE
jgi:hypothetical protein